MSSQGRRSGGGRSKIDWAAAKAFYVGLTSGERTYAAVAKEFRVSAVAVRKHAHAEGWNEAADEADVRVERTLLERAIRTREERGEVTLRIIDESYDQLQELLLAGKLEIKLSDFPALDRVARLEGGEATDHVTYDEMRGAINIILVRAAQYVPKGKRETFLAEVNEALGAGA